MNNPEYVKIKDKLYKINTSYKVGLKCQEIALDDEIDDYERALGIIYLLFGDEGLDDKENRGKLLELGMKYLSCGVEVENEEEPDMDLIQDLKLIKASFKSDYKIDLNVEELCWHDFYMYLNGLTDKCILNRVREIRTMDLNEIKDVKTKERLKKQKKAFMLKKKHKKISGKEMRNVENFYKLTGIERSKYE
jgi:hypothetical protein